MMIKKRPEGPKKSLMPVELYLERSKLVEMAHKEESKFIKIVKDHGIKDLTKFVGYECEP